MSNRFLSVLVLLVIFGTIFGAYWYFFVANVGSIVVTIAWASEVQVNLSTEFKYEKSQTCTETCIFEWIPPVNMTVIASKEWFESDTQFFKLQRGEKKVLSLTMKKKVILEEKGTNKQEKLLFLKLKAALTNDTESGSLSLIGIFQGKGYVYSTVTGFTLFTYNISGTKTPILELPWLGVKKIVWNASEWILLIQWEKNNGFLDLSTGIYTKLILATESQYVKKGILANQYIIRASDGIYLMNIKDGTTQKDGIYDDYILVAPGKILGLLKKSSTDKMSLLNFPIDGTSKLILQDIATRDRRAVYSTDDDIIGIQKIEWNIIMTDAAGKNGEIKNLEF